MTEQKESPLLVEAKRVLANLEQWKNEVGKLHSQVERAKQERDELARKLGLAQRDSIEMSDDLHVARTTNEELAIERDRYKAALEKIWYGLTDSGVPMGGAVIQTIATQALSPDSQQGERFGARIDRSKYNPSEGWCVSLPDLRHLNRAGEWTDGVDASRPRHLWFWPSESSARAALANAPDPFAQNGERFGAELKTDGFGFFAVVLPDGRQLTKIGSWCKGVAPPPGFVYANTAEEARAALAAASDPTAPPCEVCEILRSHGLEVMCCKAAKT